MAVGASIVPHINAVPAGRASLTMTGPWAAGAMSRSTTRR